MSLETIVHVRIGSLNGGKVYRTQAPDSVQAPFIVWQRISTNFDNMQEGGTPELNASRVQVSCYGATQSSAKSLITSVIAAMMADPDAAGISILDSSEGFESEAALYRADADFQVWADN